MKINKEVGFLLFSEGKDKLMFSCRLETSKIGCQIIQPSLATWQEFLVRSEEF